MLRVLLGLSELRIPRPTIPLTCAVIAPAALHAPGTLAYLHAPHYSSHSPVLRVLRLLLWLSMLRALLGFSELPITIPTYLCSDCSGSSPYSGCSFGSPSSLSTHLCYDCSGGSPYSGCSSGSLDCVCSCGSPEFLSGILHGNSPPPAVQKYKIIF